MGFGPEGGAAEEANVVAGLGHDYADLGGDGVGPGAGQQGSEGFEERVAGGGHASTHDDEFRGESQNQVSDADSEVSADLIIDPGGFRIASRGAFGDLRDFEAEGVAEGDAGGELFDSFAGGTVDNGVADFGEGVPAPEHSTVQDDATSHAGACGDVDHVAGATSGTEVEFT